MESSILSEVDDTSILRTGLPTPLWPSAQLATGHSPLAPRSGLERSDFVQWHFPTRGLRTESVGSLALSGHTGHTRRVNRAIDAKTHANGVPRSIDTAMG